MLWGFFLLFVAFCPQYSECLTLNVERNETNFTFSSGILSQINFYVDGGTSETMEVRILVQHRGLNKDSFDRQCIVTRSPRKNCNSTNEICRCIGNTTGLIEFSLQKTFVEKDSGDWLLSIWEHRNLSRIVRINVVDSVSSEPKSSPLISSTVFGTPVSTRKSIEQTTIQSTKLTKSRRTLKTVTYTSQAAEVAHTTIITSATTAKDVAIVSGQSGKNAAASQAESGETKSPLIPIIVTLGALSAVVLFLSFLVWCHPRFIPGLRRARNLESDQDTRKTTTPEIMDLFPWSGEPSPENSTLPVGSDSLGESPYVEGDTPHSASYANTTTCGTGEKKHSDYLTPVWDPRIYALPMGQPESEALSVAVQKPSVSRGYRERSPIFAVFEQNLRGGKLLSASDNQNSNDTCTGSIERIVNRSHHDANHGTYMTPVQLSSSQSLYPPPRTSL